MSVLFLLVVVCLLFVCWLVLVFIIVASDGVPGVLQTVIRFYIKVITVPSQIPACKISSKTYVSLYTRFYLFIYKCIYFHFMSMNVLLVHWYENQVNAWCP